MRMERAKWKRPSDRRIKDLQKKNEDYAVECSNLGLEINRRDKTIVGLKAENAKAVDNVRWLEQRISQCSEMIDVMLKVEYPGPLGIIKTCECGRREERVHEEIDAAQMTREERLLRAVKDRLNRAVLVLPALVPSSLCEPGFYR